jgi:autotransporter-associated beta strand protein
LAPASGSITTGWRRQLEHARKSRASHRVRLYAGTTTVQDAGTQLRIGAGGTTGSLGAGEVSNAGAIVFDRSDAISVGNAISGSGSLTQAGSGTTTLSGTNSYSGNTTISAGTLEVTGVLGGGSYAGGIANAGALVFNSASSQTLSGAVSGAGSLTKNGAGNLVLSGSNSYTGPTSVADGRLSVNGSLAGTAVTVANAAELGGTGSIGGTVAVSTGGRLAPGNSIGVLTQGETTFDNGAIFEYEVDSTDLGALGSAADLLVVNGDLDIAAGTLLEFSDLAAQAQAFVEDTTVFAMINYTGAWNQGLFTYNGQELGNLSRFFVGDQQWEIDHAYAYNTANPTTTRPLNFQGSHVPASGTQTFVTVTAVPEPATLALLAAAAGLCLRARRFLA